MKETTQKRVEQIKEKVDLLAVLLHYNFKVHDLKDYEQQFPCPLHGDGRDNKPSARLYPDQNLFYCFACGRQRDAIAVAQEVEGLSFGQALRALEERYGLKSFVYPKEEKIELDFDPSIPIEDVEERIERMLQIRTDEKTLSMERLALLWDRFDLIKASKHKKPEHYNMLRQKIVAEV